MNYRGGGAPENSSLRGKKAGFTLAEVLITIGIIGIVAAMTLPTVIQDHKKKVLATKLQKFYTVMNQAIMLAENKHGERETWFQDVYGVDADGNSLNKAWFDLYLKEHLNILKESDTTADGVVIYYLVDGGAFSNVGSNGRDWTFYPGDPEKCLKKYSGGHDGWGICKFAFFYNPVSTNIKGRVFGPYGQSSWDGSKSNLYNHSLFGCSKSSTWAAYCTLLIQYNNWMIPKDYPFKIWY